MNTERQISAILLSLLEEIYSCSHFRQHHNGLCWSVHVCRLQWGYGSSISFLLKEKLKDMFVQWPKFSGVTEYPIPGSMKGAEQEYNIASYSSSMWNKTTEYGLLRWELLEWLIESLIVRPES